MDKTPANNLRFEVATLDDLQHRLPSGHLPLPETRRSIGQDAARRTVREILIPRTIGNVSGERRIPGSVPLGAGDLFRCILSDRINLPRPNGDI